MILLCSVCAQFQAGEGQLCETAGLKEHGSGEKAEVREQNQQ